MTEPNDAHPIAVSQRYATMVVAALSVIVLTCVAFLAPLPYVTMKPGPAFNTLGTFDDKPLFTFGKGVKTYPTTGALDFTTVSVTRANTHVSLFEAVTSYFDKNIAVVPKSLIYPDHQSAKSSSREGAAQLASSKDTSRAAALKAAGYKVPSVPVVQAVLADGAAKGRLAAGDVIKQIDGKKISTAKGVVAAVGMHQPGDKVNIVVSRDGATKTITLTTRPDAKDKKAPRIGISIGEHFVFPIQITNNVGEEIGGPSAGTMFALGIYDRLTPGSLTAGKRIAGTGEITGDGIVQPIGGVRQKIAGAHAQKATIFLVPDVNCKEAAGGKDFGIKLVRIKTLKGAISALEKLATDPKAKVPTCN